MSSPPEDPWSAGWEANRLRKLTRALDWTPAQRLAWLEEMIAIAYAAGALPRRRTPDPIGGPEAAS